MSKESNSLKLTVKSNSGTYTHTCDQGQTLLETLRDKGHDVISPCGGNGTCGKCRLYIQGEGWVTSCIYSIDHDIEVVLPDPGEARVLTTQYEHTRELPVDPGEVAGLSFQPVGVAIDLGTTTIAFYLLDLSTGVIVNTRSAMNPQKKYGADLISRIHYSMTHKEGKEKLQQEILTAINHNLELFTSQNQLRAENLVKISITGNTTMLHMLLGEDASSIALAPFKPVFVSRQERKGRELQLACHPEAGVELLPSVSAYVGADIVAGLASLDPPEDLHTYLYLDIGTNGEIAVVTPEKIYCCSAAAGPAFEGANIKCGMPAVDGAISSYEHGQHKTIGNRPPAGICGSGLMDIVAALLDQGVIDTEGSMEQEYILSKGPASAIESDIVLTPADIREVQLAKSAIISGIKVLLKQASVPVEEIQALYLAGGFGNYIREESAIRIGLIPSASRGKVMAVGNCSGSGAILALRSRSFEGVIKNVLDRTVYFELSGNEEFTMEFAMNMAFPD